MIDPADLIITNGNLIILDERNPRATAMAVRSDRIAAVGSDQQILTQYKAPQPQVIDLAGKTLLPAFCDCHLHLYAYGQQLLREADLVGTTDIPHIQSRLSDLAAKRKTGWLQGHGFDQSKLNEKRFPTRDDLDQISRTRPILISRICGHAVVANSAALALLSKEELSAGNENTGLYTEDASNAFYRRIPSLNEDEMEQAVLLAANVALKTGITSVQTLLDTPDQMIAYSRLHAKKKLPIRVVAIPPYSAVATLHAHGIRTDFGDEWLKFGPCKFFSDGSLGAQTAWLSSPYTDQPNTRGIRIYAPEDLKQKCRDAQEKGWQLAIHAIGDQALRESLDAIDHALQGESNTTWRHRIEHASLTPPDCMERMAKQKIVVTAQPQFVTSDTWTPDRIGHQRTPWAYPFKSMLTNGIPLGLSSDCPVEKLDAFDCLAAATSRHPWSPHETLTIDQALRAYCQGSAHAGHVDHQQGSLQPGKLADFIVLSADPTKLAPNQLRNLKADRVFIAGKVVKQL